MITGSKLLTVFPTEPAKRRFERRRVLETGVLDTSRLFTQKKLLERCERAARTGGLLQGSSPGKTGLLLLLEEAAESVEFSPEQPLALLSPSARAALLEQVIESFAVFAANEDTVTDWLMAHAPDHKLHGIGRLLKAWRSLCTKTGTADRFVINRALLRQIETGDLPRELEDGVCFRAVRWFNPFEEQIVAALKMRLGHEKVQIRSVLPGAHAEAAEDRLCAVVRSELMRGAEEEWKPWLEDFADAFETDDSHIPEPDSLKRVSFFVSAHPYGEIEDAARRIARAIETGTAPDEIALIVRDLGPYTDIIPDVFARFGIPYHFRRGAPAAAHPPVKTLLALLGFPQNRSRDRLCDLLLMPGVSWPGLDSGQRERLVETLRKQEPPVLRRLPGELQPLAAFKTFTRPLTPEQFSVHIRTLIEQHGLLLPDEVLALIDEFAAVGSRPAPTERLISLFEKRLNDVTVKKEDSTESGVWIINPMDAAGLRFKSVWIAGMDDRSFPQIPKADALLNDTERKALRAFLTERKIPCPQLALPETGTALIQEEILFLTAMSTAQERLTLSYTHTGTDGKELAPGEFFERMRNLTGAEKPVLGESFHTVLPPELCRAEDEIRQTLANVAAASGPPGRCDRERPPAPVLSPDSPAYRALSIWLENNPEFSATALESLARNRYVFFLERVLGIFIDRTHEDDTDPADRGSLIHTLLEKIYTAAARQSGFFASPDASPRHWKLTRTAGADSIPLAVFDPDQAEDLLAQARNLAVQEFEKAERNPSRHLGHPAVWETEKRKILQIIENFVRMDIGAARSENRYPARFEMKFGKQYALPVTLRHNGEQIPLKGKIDRIDLVFDHQGGLDRLLVVDYKGKSHNESADALKKQISLNLDCQLPLYTFAAQERFFGTHNTLELNQKTEAVYHLQERSLSSMKTHFYNRNKRISMTPELTDAFLEELFCNVRKLRAGDLSAAQLIAGGFNDWSAVCRTVAIDPKELVLNGQTAYSAEH